MGGGGIKALFNPAAAIGAITTKKATEEGTKKIFGKVPETQVPEVTPLLEIPTEAEPEVEAAKKKERKASRLRSGRQSTILSNLRQQLSPRGQAGGDQLG